jgi:hypothetical protein
MKLGERLLSKTFKNYKRNGNLQRLPCGKQVRPQKQKSEIKMKKAIISNYPRGNVGT